MSINEKNLKDISKRADHKELSRKGGIKSGEAKRRRKTLRELCEQWADMPVTDDIRKTILQKAGYSEDEITNQLMTVFALGAQASNGDVKAFEVFRDLMGQKNIEERDDEDDVNIIIDIPESSGNAEKN